MESVINNNIESVKETYNKIAKDFDKTRYSVWNSVKNFLNNIPSSSSVLELGCGNGKNMLYRDDLDFYGIDISIEQVKICQNKNLKVDEGDIINLLFESNKFDYMICIATYHHLNNDYDRQKALKEMYRCLKNNGLILITVFSMEQPTNSKFKFTVSDEIVLWNNTELRYYHIYRQGELEEEIKRLCPEFTIENIDWERGNWNIILKK
jgi:ubiquinone/menaquinone biosynthesis C-methylase UbiE